MGGLIGVATSIKNGLMPNDIVQIKGFMAMHTKVIRIKKKQGLTFEMIHNSDNIGSDMLYITLNKTTGVPQAYSGLGRVYNSSWNPILIKHDDTYVYIMKTWAGDCNIIPLLNGGIEYDYMDDFPISDLKDVTIS